MRGIKILLAAALPLVFFSCGPDSLTGEESGGVVEKRLMAVLGDGTKATVSPNGACSWSTGDEIAVGTGGSESRNMTLISCSGGSAVFSALFEPGDGPRGFAVFPASALKASGGTVVSVSYPAAYTWTKDMMCAPMFAEITGSNSSFRHLGGMISIPCAEIPEDAVRVMVASVKKRICGDFAVSDSRVESVDISGNSSVSVYFDNDGTARTFNIPLPCGTYSSVYAAFVDASGNKICEWEVLRNETVGRADMYLRAKPSAMLRAASYNIRYSYSEEAYTGPDDPRKWDARKYVVPGALERRHIDLMGTQENTQGQIADILASLPNFTVTGRCNWGETWNASSSYSNECAAIYCRNTISIEDSGTFWYSSTPAVPSRESSAYNMRCCNWAKLSFKGHEFYIYNVHLQVDEDAGDKWRAKRVQQAEMVLAEIKKVSDTYPVIMTGDFNPTLATETEAVSTRLNEGTMRDARALVASPHGSYGSLHYFSQDNPSSKRVDYVLVNDKVKVHSFWIDNNQQSTGAWESDHHPVVVDLSFND